jgi:peptidoglycan hydrolase-like protein with peptidoglycan-binding domain
MPAGVAMGNFGPMTQSAVAAYQTSKGISPASGYFGPVTRASVNSMMVVTTPGTTPGTTPTTPGTTTLEGTDGTISDVSTLSQYSNEEVGENEEEVKVLGFEIEASTDGDILVKSAKLSFDPTGNSGSDHLDDYIDSVDVWMGSTHIGSSDVDGFNQGSNDIYTKTVNFGSGVVVNSDEKEKFYVTVNAVGNLDSGDITGDSWTIGVDSVRFEDGSGVVTTESAEGDLPISGVAINFVDFGTSANTELKISTASDSPEAGVVMIDEEDSTDDVVLLIGKLRLDGSSDALIDEFPVTFTATGASDLDQVTGSVKLILDGEEYSESLSTSSVLTATVTFDNLDFTLGAGDTVEFSVLADINDVDTGNLDEGDTITASVTSTNRDYIDAENEEGDQLADSNEKSGTATGDAQEFRTNGVSLDFDSASTSVTSGNSTSDDLGTFTIRFTVTAVGDTIYVSTLADATLTGVTTGKTSVHVDRSGTATVGGVSVTLTNNDDSDTNAAGLYEIEDGESETFELTSTVQLPTAGSAGQFRAVLGGVAWGTDSTDATPNNSYTSNLDDFKTSYVGLN